MPWIVLFRAGGEYGDVQAGSGARHRSTSSAQEQSLGGKGQCQGPATLRRQPHGGVKTRLRLTSEVPQRTRGPDSEPLYLFGVLRDPFGPFAPAGPRSSVLQPLRGPLAGSAPMGGIAFIMARLARAVIQSPYDPGSQKNHTAARTRLIDTVLLPIPHAAPRHGLKSGLSPCSCFGPIDVQTSRGRGHSPHYVITSSCLSHHVVSQLCTSLPVSASSEHSV